MREFISNSLRIMAISLVIGCVSTFVANAQNIGGIVVYPENVEKSEYSKVRLSIDKDKSQLWRAEYFAKDGNKYTITVNTFKVNEQIPDASFTFDKAKNPGVKVIDER